MHRHEYQIQENYLVCKQCGKKILYLTKSDNNEILVGKKSDGRNYSVRKDRRRYFFPQEWIKFIVSFKKPIHILYFKTSIHSGGRTMEVLNLKHKNINTDRGTLTFEVVKNRTAKKNICAVGKSRSFFIASNFITAYKKFIRGKNINPEDYIFLDTNKLPEDYEDLKNKEKEKYYHNKKVSYNTLLKRHLKKTGIEDWYNFSLHNLRKTYGMWMRSLNIDSGDLCYRLGHDMNTYIKHYGSSLIFDTNEKIQIQKILGEVK